MDAVDINGYTPFDLAVRGKHKQCEAFLKAVCQPQMNGKVRVSVSPVLHSIQANLKWTLFNDRYIRINHFGCLKGVL